METLRALHRLGQLGSGTSGFSITADDSSFHHDATSCSPQNVSPSPTYLTTTSALPGHGANTCKRRIDFGNYCQRLQNPQELKMRMGRGKYQTPAVLRRNERERNRVSMVNTGFNTLRQHVPQVADNKKISKVDTLRAAVDYIKQLQELLGEENIVSSENMSSKTSCKTRSDCSSSSPASDRTPSPTGYSSDSARSADDDVIEINPYDNDLAELAGWLQ